jgi:ATP-binding cassette subfamily F protein 3
MISVNQLTVEFGGAALFKEVSFLVNPKDRIGLVGKNGAGKTTLLRIFAGKQAPSSGEVVIPSDLKIGYLPQQMIHSDGRTVMEETRLAFEDVLYTEEELEKVQKELSHREDFESESYMNLAHRLSSLTERLHILGNTEIDAASERTLLGLGFDAGDFNRQTREFSGGWRMRIELAKVLLQKPDVLLLDEPTNHLDIESISWLESFLQTYSGAVVLVSHDRAFLDHVTHRTVEIVLGSLYDYKAPYSQYVILRQERRDQQLAAYRNQQKMIQDTEDFIERFRYKPTKSIQVQSRIKQLEKIVRIEVDEEDRSAMHIKFPPAPRSGTVVVEADNFCKRFGEKVILDDIQLHITRGEKVAFVGRNGEGKTTFARAIIGELPFEKGICRLGHNVQLGYFAQNQDEIMDGEATVFDTLERVAVGDIRTKLRDLLGAFLFKGEDVDKKVKVLSGGERSRLAMVKLLLEPHNLLVLDEPTNHLDMRSKDILKEALLAYDGTLIVVSHDRDFLNGLTEKIYEFREKKIFEYRGGIYDFLEKKQLLSLHELDQKNRESVPESPVSGEIAPSGQMDYREKKEYERRVRKASADIKKSEERISSLEKELEELNAQMSHPEQLSSDIFTMHHTMQKALENEMTEWERLSAALEKLQALR